LESPVRNRLLLVAAGLLFSTGGAAIKAASLTGWQVASFRSAVAAAVLLAAFPNARRRWHWRMLPVAAAYAATGRFNDAITTAQKAVELAKAAGQAQVVSEIETRLELYRAGRAYHAPASVTSPHGP